MRNQHIVIGLGSNIEPRIDYLREALAFIKKIDSVNVLAVASIYESDAELKINAPTIWQKKYLNSAVLVEIKHISIKNFSFTDLLQEIKKIEIAMGRTSREQWAPRPIDLDLLWADGVNLDLPNLKIPHASLNERPFALLPLIELVPELKIDRPHWAHDWVAEKPFATKRSVEYVWPKLVGILNMTVDSFSDGGQYLSADQLAAQVQKLTFEGADIIDIGAESARPNAQSIDTETEFKYLKLALDTLEQAKCQAKISIDCRRAEVLQKILEKYNVNYLNDVSGFVNTAMQEILLQSQLPAFVMHSLTVPAKSDIVINENLEPTDLLSQWWAQKVIALKNLGIDQSKLIFDPGIGFSKSKEQNFYILNNLVKFSCVEENIMIGHSRKSFLQKITDNEAHGRDLETALVTQNLNQAFVQYLRVHNVKSQKIALKYRGYR